MILPLILGVLVLTVVSTPLLDRMLGRNAGWPLAVVFAALAAAIGSLAPQVIGRGDTIEHVVTWMPSLDISVRLRMDGTSWLFAMLVVGIGALILAYSTRYFPPGRRTGFYALMTTFAVAMMGLVLADDVVLMFVFWELTTICSFYLIGLSGEKANRPAVRTFLLTAMGGLALLTAVVMLVVEAGTTQLSVILATVEWSDSPGWSAAVAALIILAGFTKSAQFPFHYWLPDAMAASTPVSAYLHAATMVKAGIYLLMRFTPIFGDFPVWNVTLITAGLVTAVIGALFALQRTDLKELLAYSTVSQLGLLVAIIGVGTPYALAAAALHTLAHALFKAALFMLMGVIDTRNGTRDIRELPGLRRAMPVTATLMTVSALSMAGVPPLLGFVSKETLFAAIADGPWTTPVTVVVATAAVGAAVLTFAYSFRMVHGAFWGEPGPSRDGEGSAAYLVGPGVAAVAGLGLGLAVPVLDPLVERVVLDTTTVEHTAHLALWHGFNVPLVMSMLAIAGGSVLAWRRVQVARAVERPLVPVKGTEVFEGVHRGIIGGGVRVGRLTGSNAPAPHLAAVLGTLGVVALTVMVLNPPVPQYPATTTRTADWLLVGLIVVAVVAVVVTRARLAAVALVGVSGFAVALWFLLLGGFDLALTQLLVEILTVVVAVLVLRRLPRKFHPVRRGRAALAGGVAVVVGLAAGLAAYNLTGRRDISAAGQYFLTNAEPETGGTNVVNTILVDFRALDTLGELAVLGIAGLIIVAVLDSARLNHGRLPEPVVALSGNPVFSAVQNSLIMRTVALRLGPVLTIWSLYLLLRGHNAPGGGFISALVGGAGFALAYLAASSAAKARIRLPFTLLIAAGVAIAGGIGLVGYVDDSYLRPLHAEIPLPWGGYYHFTTALIFDVGVYLAVVGVLLTALNRLGVEDDVHAEDARAGQPSTDEGDPDESDEADRLLDEHTVPAGHEGGAR
ncbi:DUF4040 family protein [Cellulomonas bogoriensis]|uniref:Cation:proton antiporter n=1 Tax=Cellulomonas bogoriensis 69B4 = DSM 16987 TaxID=1386082 RepID=A0A0A0C3E0_9CELL|nr:DUF4040 family protein [Cellulomonas bogoriensis]KGM13879.1 cation:proton antiporter [Cellulomonas bogoriensis 69B4 = DSM 16987]